MTTRNDIRGILYPLDISIYVLLNLQFSILIFKKKPVPVNRLPEGILRKWAELAEPAMETFEGIALLCKTLNWIWIKEKRGKKQALILEKKHNPVFPAWWSSPSKSLQLANVPLTSVLINNDYQVAIFIKLPALRHKRKMYVICKYCPSRMPCRFDIKHKLW